LNARCRCASSGIIRRIAMQFRMFIPILILASFAFPQMPAQGTFYYQLTPRQATVGQPITFECFVFNMCLYFYEVTYELLPTPISSKKTTIINMNAKIKPQCATAAGYSGPKIVFENLEVGAYILQFDSTSDFKKDLGDSNKFEIIPPSSLVSKTKSEKKIGDPWIRLETTRIDGKEIKRE
jgi:hypothetical protein